jgi:hypothetical protein
MTGQAPDHQKQVCVRCKEFKDPDKFCSPKLSIMYCAEFSIPLPTSAEHTSSLPVMLCTACLRTLAKRKNQKRHDRKPKYRLSKNIRTGIYKSLRTGCGGLWEDRVGYTLSQLKEHLQSQFKDGMSWQNFGQWQIDHIRPVYSFDFSKYEDEDFKRCWSLSNLRPLWAKDNWKRKKNRQPMRKCFDESPYDSCLDCPKAVHIKYIGRVCQRFHRKVPEWWETEQR